MSRFKLVVSEALRSIGANLSTSFAATMTVLIGMFLLGLLIALGIWVVSWSDHVKDQLEVKVFFVDGVTPKQVNAVGAYLRTNAERDQGLPVRLEGRGAQADARSATRELTDEPAVRTRCPRRTRSRRSAAEEVKEISAGDPRAEVRGRRAREGRPADVEADPPGRARDRGRVPRRGRRAARRVGAADREHDPALDLLATARDRGDEARRRDELVRARAVHGRGAALRPRRRARRGRAAAAREGDRAAGDPRARSTRPTTSARSASR